MLSKPSVYQMRFITPQPLPPAAYIVGIVPRTIPTISGAVRKRALQLVIRLSCLRTFTS
jgi:hypothetical protein